MPRVFVGTFWPEQRGRPITLHTSNACGDEKRQKRDPLRRDRPRRAIGAGDVEQMIEQEEKRPFNFLWES